MQKTVSAIKGSPHQEIRHSSAGPSKAPDAIAGMFNHIAKTYDLLNDLMTAGLHRQWKRNACKMLHPKPGDRILDLCTGTGDLAGLLAPQVGAKGCVVAVDFSENMLQIARERFTQDNIHWMQGDALTLPFADNAFDGSIISFGLRNVASVKQVLAEMVRVTKPDGWVVNLDTASDCKNPLFWLYFSIVMPVLGRLVSKDANAYRYLCRSTRAFETPKQILAMLQDLGLSHCHVAYLGFGSVSIQRGQKNF